MLSKKIHILSIEDDRKMAKTLKVGLEDETFEVTNCTNGVDGLELAQRGCFDLILFDIHLPKKDGLAILYELRAAGDQTPIMMLTATSETADIVAGLDLGADAYMKKPFIFAELRARAKALVRRHRLNLGNDIRYADIRIDPVNHKVWRGNKKINLTPAEYAMFSLMAKNVGTVLSRAELAESALDYKPCSFSNIVDVYINYLRKKIDDASPTKLIHTVRGKGYLMST